MSIFNLGRPTLLNRTPNSLYAGAPHWLSWNPYRTAAPAAAVTAPAVAGRWWNWNPYRRDVKRVERQSERLGEREGERVGYNKGRRDENRVMNRRIRRSRHPILGGLVFLAAVAGVGFVGLAYEEGSFSAGGAAVDHQIAAWRGDLMAPVSNAGARSGQALQDAGRTISTKSQQLSQPGG